MASTWESRLEASGLVRSVNARMMSITISAGFRPKPTLAANPFET